MKNILVTGAGKGIGFATVVSLVKKNYFVFALIKNKKDNKYFKKFKNIKIYNGDVKNIELIKKIIKDSNSLSKPITGLVNNAGIRQRKEFLKINKKDLNLVFQNNFFSLFYLTQLFSKNLINKKLSGSVVNLASIVGQNGFNNLSGYASTKGAIISLTKSLSVELAKYNIRVNSVSPGFTKTSYYKKFKKKKKLHKWTLSRIPMSRWGEPNEVSEIITFLISENSSYINGENINIDGGWLSG